MESLKKTRIIYWVTTAIIFIFEGVVPAFTSQSAMAKEGIRHLGYPDYFGIALAVFKVIGALILIVPKLPTRLKDWAYAGFSFDFIFAAISLGVVDGIKGLTFFPVTFLVILIVSYVSYHKINKQLRLVNNVN